ncbi:LysR substrate-binding domain-containing protein [Terrihabitans sp. B22-R8]|uniref:LysR substrate-binding domain-containing protein n=1 Tax=Terrihabitans sp. B22-R8 TaxID=3425128 RepID=UPI00403C3616
MSDDNLRQNFLAGMSFAASTVNIVTTDGPAGRFGLTVSAMASVSADTPKPTLLVCVHHLSPAARAILENGVFCVNVLRDDQSYISDCFAGRFKTADGDKFSCTSWTPEVTGAPRVVDPLVAFDCRVVSSQQVGTHFVLFGEVESIFTMGAGSPLIYANRAYGTPARIENGPRDTDTPAETLRLGIFHTFGPYVVPEILERLTKKGRRLDLKLVEGDQRRVVESLKAGEVDAALVYDMDMPAGVDVERLSALQPYVLLPAGHKFADQGAVPLADLAAEPMILLDAPPSGDYFKSLFAAEGLTPNIRFRSHSFEMVRGLVGRGLGYALLAAKPASAMSYDGRALVTKPLSDRTEPSHMALAVRAEGELPVAAAAFAAECRALFQPA